jgi:hypothetical protein
MIVEWFVPAPQPVTEWVGNEGASLFSGLSGGTSFVASIIGPPGSFVIPGPGFAVVGAEIRYAISTLTRA